MRREAGPSTTYAAHECPRSFKGALFTERRRSRVAALALTRQPGKDITIVGSGALFPSLLRDDLLDELRLMVHPIVVGRGKRLFEEGGDQKALELLDSKTFGTGVLNLTYQPAQS
jgi:dihydrofolate reductase